MPYDYEKSRAFDRRRGLYKESNVMVISNIIREADPEGEGAFGFTKGKEYCERTKVKRKKGGQ